MFFVRVFLCGPKGHPRVRYLELGFLRGLTARLDPASQFFVFLVFLLSHV